MSVVVRLRLTLDLVVSNEECLSYLSSDVLKLLADLRDRHIVETTLGVKIEPTYVEREPIRSG